MSTATVAGTRVGAGAARRQAGAVALVVGGAASFLFHVLYEIGHGPTVVNEHGVVLGLTNDQWSYVGVVWMALVGFGLLALPRRGRATRWALGLLLTGLLVRGVANWWFGFYVPGELLLIAGRIALGTAIVREHVLPRWTAVPMFAAAAGWVGFAADPDAFYDTSFDVLDITGSVNDLLTLVAASAWICLGVGLLQTSRGSVTTPPLSSDATTARHRGPELVERGPAPIA